mgnify:CR=1 FL=1
MWYYIIVSDAWEDPIRFHAYVEADSEDEAIQRGTNKSISYNGESASDSNVEEVKQVTKDSSLDRLNDMAANPQEYELMEYGQTRVIPK